MWCKKRYSGVETGKDKFPMYYKVKDMEEDIWYIYKDD